MQAKKKKENAENENPNAQMLKPNGYDISLKLETTTSLSCSVFSEFSFHIPLLQSPVKVFENHFSMIEGKNQKEKL